MAMRLKSLQYIPTDHFRGFNKKEAFACFVESFLARYFFET